ncbi:MAG: thymidine phosphorylase [Chloroflexota bacterium]|nr:MAG: thymidine phosphorylase [Chloroflexota bacterium]
MRAVDIIIKKRDRGELTREEIKFFINGFNNGEIPDYQVSAWAMAVLLNGMTARETTDLTLVLAESGEMLDCTVAVPVAVDKHSTGGVGDKTTLVVQPLVAACGLPVGKISGRGLGFSGGTLDKLESIPGCRVDLTTEEFLDQLRSVGVVLTGQTANLAPADGKLYALRDVTGTVQSIPLIASSVMSKKIAGGATAVLLDVKVGSGAFMKDLDQARQLARLMVEIAEGSGRKSVALLSNMNQPLGRAVGNALEVREAIETLHNQGPQDFREHCLVVAGHMLALGGKVDNAEEGRKAAEVSLENGSAWDKFKTLITIQGGDIEYLDAPERLPVARYVEPVRSTRAGYLSWVDAQIVGETSVDLGAGRAKKGEPIDHAVGIEVIHKVGDYVEKDQALFIVHANDESRFIAAKEQLLDALAWSEQPVDSQPLFYEVIS